MTPEHTTLQAARRHRVSVLRVIRSELLKFVSLRANVITLLAVIPLGLMFVVLGSGGIRDFLTEDPASNLSLGLERVASPSSIGYLFAIVVSVLCVCGEYSTGQIGSTLTAVPRRFVMLVGKAVAIAISVWIVFFVSVLLSAAVGLPLLLSGGPFPQPAEMLVPVVMTAAGTATGGAMIALISLCIGGVLRSIAFAIAASFGLILVVPQLLPFAPFQWIKGLYPYTPTELATSLQKSVPDVPHLTSLFVFTGLVAVGVAVWGALLARRDA